MGLEQEFKEILGNIYQILKPLGWKKERYNFRLYGNDGLHKIINFQVSRWNTPDRVRFYINIGFYIQKPTEELNLSFDECECNLRQRVQKDGYDYLLTIKKDKAAVEAEIKEVIVNKALPFLDQYNTKEEFLLRSKSNKNSLF